jgi:outer membrane protein W
MKKIFIGFILIFLSFSNLYAQKKDIVEYQQNWDKQKIFWGYYLGLNYKSLKISYLTADNKYIDIETSAGFNVGLIGNYRLHKNISLRLEPGLSSNTNKLSFTYIPGGAKDSIRKINSTYLRIPVLLKFNTNRYNNIRPYAIGGVSYDYNFSSNQDNPDDNYEGEFRMKKSNFMYELGLGIDFYLPYFIFSPSIRGIFAINNELVRDNNPDSPWTGNIDYFGTRGFFLKLAFH